eukprot:897353-Amphidinium_carterae.1
MDVETFTRMARDMQGKGSALHGASTHKRNFQVAWMLKCVCMADLLRTTSDMREVLQSSLEMLLPEVIRGAFRKMLEESAAAIPHPGTVSRWRFLVDAAFMCVRRLSNANMECYRYLMADASVQHSHHFEHVLERSVPAHLASQLHADAVKLVLLWFFTMGRSRWETISLDYAMIIVLLLCALG